MTPFTLGDMTFVLHECPDDGPEIIDEWGQVIGNPGPKIGVAGVMRRYLIMRADDVRADANLLAVGGLTVAEKRRFEQLVGLRKRLLAAEEDLRPRRLTQSEEKQHEAS